MFMSIEYIQTVNSSMDCGRGQWSRSFVNSGISCSRRRAASCGRTGRSKVGFFGTSEQSEVAPHVHQPSGNFPLPTQSTPLYLRLLLSCPRVAGAAFS